jgi:soluble lytic murein transglycosylase
MPKVASLIIILSLLLAGCTMPAPTPAPTQAPAVDQPGSENSIPPSSDGSPVVESTAAPETEAPVNSAPQGQAAPAVVSPLSEGKDALFAGDYDLAIEIFNSVVQESSQPGDTPAALLGLAQTRIRQGDCPAALEDIHKIINDYSDSYERANAQYFLGECLEKDEKYLEAAQAYARYLDFRPGLIDTLINEKTGDAYFAAEQYNQAVTAYNAAMPSAGTTATNRLKIKVAKSLKAQGYVTEATTLLLEIYDSPNSNDYDKAAANLLLGQVYLSIQEPEQAYARFKDSVEKFPLAYDSYSALSALVDANIEVNDYQRGLVDYYAGQYGLAIDAFKREVLNNPNHEGSAHHFNALSLRTIDQPEAAIAEWDALIKDHPADPYWINAWEEKAYTQWAYLDRFSFAAETLLSFVRLYPTDNHAADFLFEAGRIYERNNDLANAAATWERVLAEYPSAAIGYRSLFLAGISYYRLGDYASAQTTFQRAQVLSTTTEDSAASALWVGKTEMIAGNLDGAKTSWFQAAQMDPTGYYSERANDLLNDRPTFSTPENYDLAVDLNAERTQAQAWMRKTFKLAPEIALNGLGKFAADPRFFKANAYYELGLYELASNEMESLRTDLENDPVQTFLLIDQCLQLGLNRSAIFAARQVLTLANLDDAGTLREAPAYFNHVRFGVYFRKYLLEAAQAENLQPLFLASVIRQESMFEGFVESSAGARGIMQIMPATGEETAAMMAWPANYTDDDLYRPMVSIQFGAHYLRRQIDLFDGNLAAGLAGYNGGSGNASIWQTFANNDPDLFLEVIRFDETRKYVMQISDFLNIYSGIYERNP